MNMRWRSLAFNICFFAWAMLAAAIFAPLFLLSSGAALYAARPWALGALWLARVILGISYEVRGTQHLTHAPVIYASKHQSAWDTIIFLILLRHPAYVLKRELLHIPLWGWYLWRMKMIAIDRSSKTSGMKRMLKSAKEALKNGRAVVIFPEGTRTRPGAAPHYHPGVVALYSMMHVPVVPVALNSGCYWGKNAFFKRRGTIVIEFLPAIAPGLPRDKFLSILEGSIETASAALLAEANQQATTHAPIRKKA